MSWCLQALGEAPPCHLRNLRKDSHSFGNWVQLISHETRYRVKTEKGTTSASLDRPPYGRPGNLYCCWSYRCHPLIHSPEARQQQLLVTRPSESSSRPPRTHLSLGPKATASHSRSWLVKAQPELEDLTALPVYPSSWLVNTQWELENPVIGCKWASKVTLAPSLMGITAVFYIELASATHCDWNLGQKLLLAVCCPHRSGEYHPY